MAIKASTPKGFRDFLPEQANAREFVVGKIREVFRKFGFEPLETPALEFAETLKGKYGEEEKLIYKFSTKGGDQVALRYDQTVPLARVVAQYPELPKPFKRYQIQPVWRGENPQKGRFREFLQCDADIVGSASPLADAEILLLVYQIYNNLGLDVLLKVNDRTLLSQISANSLSAIDKLNKIGEDGVLKELQQKGLTEIQAKKVITEVKSFQASVSLKNIMDLYEKMGGPKDSWKFDPTMVRGLDYYTGLIIEVVLKDDQSSSSLGGGGRYGELIGKFTGIAQPAVGFSVGLDRTLEVLKEKNLLPKNSSSAKVLVTVFSPDLLEKSIEVVLRLRSAGIFTELWLDPESKLDKQLKYADQKGIPFAIIIGPDETRTGKVTLKNLQTQTQESITLDETIKKLSS